MDSNPLLNPVGSLPPEVYWRRRAMAGVLAVLVVWFAWSELNGRSGANAAPSPRHPGTVTPAPTTTSPTPTPTPTPAKTKAAKTTSKKAVAKTTPSVSPKPTATVPRCPDAVIKLTVSSDHALYQAGELPHFALSVENTGSTSCTIDVGTAARSFRVTSGTDRIWSSSDCTKKTANVAVFKPKESVGYSHVWNRQRSSVVGCAAAGTAARPGTYKLVGKVGDLTSRGAVFALRG